MKGAAREKVSVIKQRRNETFQCRIFENSSTVKVPPCISLLSVYIVSFPTLCDDE